MEEEILQLGSIASFTPRQQEWARDVRLRLYIGLVLHFGRGMEVVIVLAKVREQEEDARP